MLEITLPLDERGRALVHVTIWLSTPEAEVLQDQGLELPQGVMTKALIDTGATSTCIDCTIAAKLGLAAKDFSPVNTPSSGTTPAYHPIYDISMLWTTHNRQIKLWDAVRAVGCDFSAQDIDVLIGMDVLSHCYFACNGLGASFTLIFPKHDTGIAGPVDPQK